MIEHTVTSGDTVSKVANYYGVRPFDLLSLNPSIYSERTYLPVGTKVVVPARKKIDYDPLHMNVEFSHRDLQLLIPTLQKKNVSVEIIGESVMKKPLYAFSIGTGKKEIFFSGGWHANEWHTSKFLTLFLKELAEHNEKKEKWYGYPVEHILNMVTLHVVPLVNPDGVDLVLQGIDQSHPYYEKVHTINKGVRRFDHWSSNIRGVDLNHQWPAGWEIEAKRSPHIPWPRHFSGTAPLTEPEAKAIYRYTLHHNFSYVLAFHSQGQEIYWGYNHLEPKASRSFVQRLARVSSYNPVQAAGSVAGYKDWFIKETKKAGFTIEMGVGKNPLPPKAFAEIWANNVLLALEALTL